jgi:hypothetical protein
MKEINLFDNEPIYNKGDTVIFTLGEGGKLTEGCIIELEPISYLDGIKQSMQYIIKVEGINSRMHVPSSFIKSKVNKTVN